jgi:hypothetical protein
VERIIGALVAVLVLIGWASGGLGSAVAGGLFGGLLALPFLWWSERRKAGYLRDFEHGVVVEAAVAHVAEDLVTDIHGGRLPVYRIEIFWAVDGRDHWVGHFFSPRAPSVVPPSTGSVWPLLFAPNAGGRAMVLEDPMMFQAVNKVRPRS